MTTLLASPGVEALRDNGTAAMSRAAASGVDPEIEIRQTVDAALASAARGTMEQLKRNMK